MKISGWGRYPVTEATLLTPKTRADFAESLKHHCITPRGLGRSYGDSANGPSVAQTERWDHFLEFDASQGIIRCEAGVSLAQILEVIVPQGWFLPVTSGTSFVTIGGAIASDIHGKNHHLLGTFSQHVLSMEMMLGNGEITSISPAILPELFQATCGGMGLTGMILNATIQLIPIQSAFISQTTIKTKSLEETCEQFNLHGDSTYSVAWIDCLSTGENLGRSLLMLGEHAQEGSLALEHPKVLSMPFSLPEAVLNRYSITAFNSLYYHKNINRLHTAAIPLKKYFYPLDSIANWNRMYGRSGFVQYQFAIPKEVGVIGLKKILQEIAQSGMGSFLAVLKVFGKANSNYLSFPIEGYTLALDFKACAATFALLKHLDSMIADYSGRLYLTKDALMTEALFKKSYPRWEQFEEIRHQYGAIGKFSSNQARRLGLL